MGGGHQSVRLRAVVRRMSRNEGFAPPGEPVQLKLLAGLSAEDLFEPGGHLVRGIAGGVHRAEEHLAITLVTESARPVLPTGGAGRWCPERPAERCTARGKAAAAIIPLTSTPWGVAVAVLVTVGLAGRGVVILRAGRAGVRALPLTGALRLITVRGAGIPGAIVRRWAIVALIVAPSGGAGVVAFRAGPSVALAVTLWPTPLRTPHLGILG